MKALGMIETYGLIGAIEAADVMLKTANVTLLKKEIVKGGLILVSITGDVGAVKTAVEAATTAVTRLGAQVLYGSHVIPRPDFQLDSFYPRKKENQAFVEEAQSEDNFIQNEESTEEVIEEIPEEMEAKTNISLEILEDTEVVLSSTEKLSMTPQEYKRSLQKLRVAELRDKLTHQNIILDEGTDVMTLTKKQLTAILVDDFEKNS